MVKKQPSIILTAGILTICHKLNAIIVPNAIMQTSLNIVLKTHQVKLI